MDEPKPCPPYEQEGLIVGQSFNGRFRKFCLCEYEDDAKNLVELLNSPRRAVDEKVKAVVEAARKHCHYKSVIEAGMRTPCQGELTGKCSLMDALAALDVSESGEKK